MGYQIPVDVHRFRFSVSVLLEITALAAWWSAHFRDISTLYYTFQIYLVTHSRELISLVIFKLALKIFQKTLNSTSKTLYAQ